MNRTEIENKIKQLEAQLEQQKFDYYRFIGQTQGQLYAYQEMIKSMDEIEISKEPKAKDKQNVDTTNI